MLVYNYIGVPLDNQLIAEVSDCQNLKKSGLNTPNLLKLEFWHRSPDFKQQFPPSQPAPVARAGRP